MESLMKKSTTGYSPLWLNLACYELKVFGDFATLKNKIESLPDNIDGLISHMLERVNSEYDKDFVNQVN